MKKKHKNKPGYECICPFCCSRFHPKSYLMVKYPYASYVIDKVPHYKVYYVECPGCGVQGVSDENKKKAISNFRDWWKRFQEAEEKNKKKKA